jgi:hypothetical protein
MSTPQWSHCEIFKNCWPVVDGGSTVEGARKLTHIDCRVLSCAVAPHNSAKATRKVGNTRKNTIQICGSNYIPLHQHPQRPMSNKHPLVRVMLLVYRCLCCRSNGSVTARQILRFSDRMTTVCILKNMNKNWVEFTEGFKRQHVDKLACFSMTFDTPSHWEGGSFQWFSLWELEPKFGFRVASRNSKIGRNSKVTDVPSRMSPTFDIAVNFDIGVKETDNWYVVQTFFRGPLRFLSVMPVFL